MPKFNINPGHRVVSLQLLMWLQRGVQSREYGIACQDSCQILAPLQACFAMEGYICADYVRDTPEFRLSER